MASHDLEPDHPTFLVVDDDPLMRQLVSKGLEGLCPARILEVDDGRAAQKVLLEETVDVVVTDVLMPHMDGRDLMSWARVHRPGPAWIVLSALDTFDAAVDALHLGAFDFLAKPPSIPRLRVAVRNALEQLALVRERRRLHEEVASSHQQLAEKVTQLEGLCRILEEQADVIHADLSRAEVIQRALLPELPPQLGPWCVEALYRPGKNVGGDCYDVVAIGERYLGLVVADAAGHGVASAMLSVLFKQRLKLVDDAGAALEPADVLSAVNAELHRDIVAPGMFITAVYALLDRSNGQVRVASAGHPPVLCASRGGKARCVYRTGPALGLQAHAEYRQERADLMSGDRMLLYTDGVLEGGPGSLSAEELGEGLAGCDDDRAGLLRGFYESATQAMGEDRDDVTMLLLERSFGESRFDTATPQHERAKRARCASPSVRLTEGRQGDRSFLGIEGSATWTSSTLFFEVASAMSEEHKDVIVDLSCCSYLDSTFLGTLHELVVRRPGGVRLQGVEPQIRALFEELDMASVLNRVTESAESLPGDMRPLRRAAVDVAEQGRRVLSAHEALSSLSAENEAQFRSVIESLRVDLGVGSEAAHGSAHVS